MTQALPQFSLPLCRHRGERLAAERWTCESPRLVMPGRAVGEAECRACPCADHPNDGIALNVENATTPNSRWRSKASPDMTVEGFLAMLDQTGDMPPTWPWWHVAQRAHRQLFAHHAGQPRDYPGTGRGRGIVMAAGGELYFSCAFISACVLRALGCTLPIEFWHLGSREMTDAMRRLVEPIGVTCHDAHDIHPQPRRLHGWELKPFAILHSRFEEVLFMDADNIAAADPTHLFDDPAYRELGAVFWPDLPPHISPTTWIPSLSWDVAGIEWREGPAFESGQLLINKKACWAELNLTMHLNEHSDFWYRYVYGDKDTFKLAWHKLNRRYAMPPEAGWAWPAILQHDLAGKLVFTHACQGKKQLVAGERLAALPMCDAAVEAARSLRDRWSSSGNKNSNQHSPEPGACSAMS